MKYSIDKQEKYAVFTLHEDNLNSILAPMLKTEFKVLNEEGLPNFILDLSDVKFVDSSGLSAILLAYKSCKTRGGILVICGACDSVKTLVKISQLDTILTMVPSIEEARDLIMMEELEKDING